MNALIYPVHVRRQFERRWAARATDHENRRSPAQGTDTCTTCGHVVTAPSRSTHLPTGKIINHWRCSSCGTDWETFVEAPVKEEEHKGSSMDGLVLDRNAAHLSVAPSTR